MRMPGTPSLAFLFVLVVLLPWASYRSHNRLRSAREAAGGDPLPSRSRIWAGTLLLQAVMLYLAWRVGRGFDFRIFAAPPISAAGLLQAGAALVLCFGVRALARATRSEAERRALIVFRIAPRTAAEHALAVATVLVTSVAEEAAYRGVGFSILWYSLGNPWWAAGISAIAFALAHRVQGWKSVGWIFLVALVMQGLVALTGTLVFAMAVHAMYDLGAGYLIAEEARRIDGGLGLPRERAGP